MADPVRRFLSSASHFREHPDSVARRRQDAAVDAAVQRLARRGPAQVVGPATVGAPARLIHRTNTVRWCPLDQRWAKWDLLGGANDFVLLAEHHHQTCEAARTRTPSRHLGELAIHWEHGAGSGLVHGETIVNCVSVHVDMVTIDRSGPGRRIQEVRIFANGELCGRGGSFGSSLGGGGGDLPAVGLIAAAIVVTADVVYGEVVPVVELWDVS